MARTRKQQQKNIGWKEPIHTQKFRTVESETMAEQGEPTRTDSSASRTDLERAILEKEREDYRHSGIPIGSDPRE